MKTYIKEFYTEKFAYQYMTQKNRACRASGNLRDVFCLVDGPSDNYAVVDLNTAIDLGGGYEWSE